MANDADAPTPTLVEAAAAGQADAVSRLLDAGATDGDVALALRMAAQHGHAEALRRVLPRVDSDDEDGAEALAVALNYASQYGREETAQLLLRAGADAEAADEIGGTSLLYAAFNGHAGVARLLARSGANVERLCPQMGETSAFLAVRGGHTAVVSALLDEGASTASDEHGSLVAHACALGQFSIVWHLVVERGLPIGGAETSAAVFPQVDQFLRQWRAGTHPLQTERAAAVRALLAVRASNSSSLPVEVAHLVGDFFHAGGAPRKRGRASASGSVPSRKAAPACPTADAELAPSAKRARVDA